MNLSTSRSRLEISWNLEPASSCCHLAVRTKSGIPPPHMPIKQELQKFEYIYFSYPYEARAKNAPDSGDAAPVDFPYFWTISRTPPTSLISAQPATSCGSGLCSSKCFRSARNCEWAKAEATYDATGSSSRRSSLERLFCD